MQSLFDNVLNAIPNIPGIYYLKMNEQNYVGSSINVKTRLHEHRSSLLRGTHDNPRMQNIFNKYGKEKCWFTVLSVSEKITREELLILEKKWIEKLGPVLNNKLDPTTQNNSLSQGKRVYQFDLAGRKIANYPSTREAERQTKITATSISATCRKNLLSAGGYLWSYDEQAKLSYDLERSKWKWRAVIMTDLTTGVETEFDNISKAARTLSLDSNFNSICATISALCNGIGKTLKYKYTFRYRG